MVPVHSEITKKNSDKSKVHFVLKQKWTMKKKHLRNAMWAPMSGGKFFWTVDTTQIASDLAPSSRLLLKIFLKI